MPNAMMASATNASHNTFPFNALFIPFILEQKIFYFEFRTLDNNF